MTTKADYRHALRVIANNPEPERSDLDRRERIQDAALFLIGVLYGALTVLIILRFTE